MSKYDKSSTTSKSIILRNTVVNTGEKKVKRVDNGFPYRPGNGSQMGLSWMG